MRYGHKNEHLNLVLILFQHDSISCVCVLVVGSTKLCVVYCRVSADVGKTSDTIVSCPLI